MKRSNHLLKFEIRSTCLREAASAKAGEARNKSKCSKSKFSRPEVSELKFLISFGFRYSDFELPPDGPGEGGGDMLWIMYHPERGKIKLIAESSWPIVKSPE
jgi:hypothetical protein